MRREGEDNTLPEFYKVVKADPLDGEFTPNKPGAKPLKSFWCQVEGVNQPVMMTKQVPNTPSLTKGHYGVLEPKRSAKGTQYFKFTSMQVPQGTQIPEYSGHAPEKQDSNSYGEGSYGRDKDMDIPTWFNPFAIMIRELWDDMNDRQTKEVVTKEAVAPVEYVPSEEPQADPEMLREIFGEDLPDPVEIPEEK